MQNFPNTGMGALAIYITLNPIFWLETACLMGIIYRNMKILFHYFPRNFLAADEPNMPFDANIPANIPL